MLWYITLSARNAPQTVNTRSWFLDGGDAAWIVQAEDRLEAIKKAEARLDAYTLAHNFVEAHLAIMIG